MTSFEIITLILAALGALGAGIAFAANNISKKFDAITAQVTQINQKLDDKVSQKTCQQRRQHMTCLHSDANQTQKLYQLLDKLNKKLDQR